MSYVIKSGVKYFEAVNPEKLIDTLHEREEQIKTILPELKRMQDNIIDKPKIEIYEGKEGIKTMHKEIIRGKQKEVLIYGNTSKHNEVMRWYFRRYIKERVKNRINARVVTERSDISIRNIKLRDEEELRQTRFFLIIFQHQY